MTWYCTSVYNQAYRVYGFLNFSSFSVFLLYLSRRAHDDTHTRTRTRPFWCLSFTEVLAIWDFCVWDTVHSGFWACAMYASRIYLDYFSSKHAPLDRAYCTSRLARFTPLKRVLGASCALVLLPLIRLQIFLYFHTHSYIHPRKQARISFPRSRTSNPILFRLLLSYSSNFNFILP